MQQRTRCNRGLGRLCGSGRPSGFERGQAAFLERSASGGESRRPRGDLESTPRPAEPEEGLCSTVHRWSHTGTAHRCLRGGTGDRPRSSAQAYPPGPGSPPRHRGVSAAPLPGPHSPSAALQVRQTGSSKHPGQCRKVLHAGIDCCSYRLLPLCQCLPTHPAETLVKGESTKRHPPCQTLCGRCSRGRSRQLGNRP